MATLTKSEIAALSVEERYALVDDIYETLLGAETEIEPPDWHKDLLDRRLKDAERFPEDSVPWEVAKAELMKKWAR